MQTVQILALGKCKEGYLREACREYEKRLSRYCRLQITELEPAALSQNPSEKEIAAALEKEGAELLKRAKGYCIAMCIEGKQLTSPDLAEKLGISTSFLGHIERGTRKASLDTLVKMANELGVSLDSLAADSLDSQLRDSGISYSRQQKLALREAVKTLAENLDAFIDNDKPTDGD